MLTITLLSHDFSIVVLTVLKFLTSIGVSKNDLEK